MRRLLLCCLLCALCAGALAQQQRVKNLLVGADNFAQPFRHGEGDQVIRHGQEFAALALQPLGGIGVAAPGTGAVMAGVISEVLPATLTLVELAAQRRRAAGQKGGHGAAVRRQQPRAELPLIRRPVPAQDFGQGNQGPERFRV